MDEKTRKEVDALKARLDGVDATLARIEGMLGRVTEMHAELDQLEANALPRYRAPRGDTHATGYRIPGPLKRRVEDLQKRMTEATPDDPPNFTEALSTAVAAGLDALLGK